MSKTSEFFLFMDAAGPVPDAVCKNKIADAVIYPGHRLCMYKSASL